MLDAIKVFHGMGYIHRDIKPANFALGRKHERNQVYIIDFGLAKEQKYANGKRKLLIAGIPINLENSTAFKGTVRYASLNAHKGRVHSF
jgi:serine/threonine protein kinase